MAVNSPLQAASARVPIRVSARGKHYELATATLIAAEGYRVLLSVSIAGIEAEGAAEVLFSVRRDRAAIGEFRLSSLCGSDGEARWSLGQAAFSVIDSAPAPGPRTYSLTADVCHGEAVIWEPQIWPSMQGR